MKTQRKNTIVLLRRDGSFTQQMAAAGLTALREPLPKELEFLTGDARDLAIVLRVFRAMVAAAPNEL